jgi:hypothetical protein
MGEIRKPDFFVVGAPKCGTSSMYYYLLQHPEIFVPHNADVTQLSENPFALGFEAARVAASLKEPHFFGSDLHFAPELLVATTTEKYMELFEGVTNEKRIGEASVYYLCSERAASEIKAFQPDARIIVMLRDPVDVMFRLHGQECVNGTESISDFEEALAAEPARFADPSIMTLKPNILETAFYRRCVTFSEQLERYYDAFGRERVHVIIYDDLRSEAQKVYSDVLRFLDVEDRPLGEAPVSNQMSQVKNMKLQRFIANPHPGLRKAVRAMIPARMRLWIAMLVIRSNIDYGARPTLDPAIRARLQGEMAGEVERLSELLGRDLTHWSRPA